MNTLIACLLITVSLPYVVKLIAGYAMQKESGGYDNNHPRQQQATLQGFSARAIAAHNNCFESLMVFSTAALTAMVTNHVTQTVQALAIIYIVSRFIYIPLYLMDKAALRSTIWLVGFVCSIIIICLSFF